MSAVEKTKLLERKYIPVGLLEPNPLNPNKMSDGEFNLLVSNLETVGFTDPVLVRPHPEKEGLYRIVGGEHRWEAAKLLGFEEVPATVIDDPDFDEDLEKFQIVRHNIIHGKMSPDRFMKLYESLSKEYNEQVASEMFGFADEDEFRKLIKKTAEGLPPEMQDAFKEASKEIKTVQDLAKVLNYLFTNFGDSLDYGYMIVDFGGKESIWLRLQKNQMKHWKGLAQQCKTQNKAMDHVMASLVQSIAKGEWPESFESVLEGCPEVDTSKVEIPTLDKIEGSL